MYRSIIRIHRVSRVASRRCYNSGPKISHDPILSAKDEDSNTHTKRVYAQPAAPNSPEVQDNSYSSYKRSKGQFVYDASHGPPVPLRKKTRPPTFIRPLLSTELSTQQKANQELINSAADLGEEIVHPKLGKGYRENLRLLDNGAFMPINFAEGPDSV